MNKKTNKSITPEKSMVSQLRPATKEDKREIIKLWQDAGQGLVDHIYSEEVWEWLYLKSPAGVISSMVAENNGQIIGHIGHIMRNLKLGEKQEKAVLYTDYLIHPSKQKTATPIRMLRYSQDYLDEIGIKVQFGFPNKSFIPIITTRKGRGKKICLMPLYMRLLSGEGLARLIGENNLQKRIIHGIGSIP